MRIWISIGVFIAMSILVIFSVNRWQESGEPKSEDPVDAVSEIPDFASYTDTGKKKKDFFEFLLPKIRAANQVQLERREFLQGLNPEALDAEQEARLYALAKRYRVTPTNITATELINQLTLRIDVVPASLILAQSANESAWGTSRFARDGNNLFGLWCFSKGCGITPRDRNDGAIHEVEKFDSVQDGVDKYVRTINSHPAYTELRAIRHELRKQESPPKGFELAKGLSNYSERGQAYIEEIQQMISYNNLEAYNLD